jgi:hypothetical protein
LLRDTDTAALLAGISSEPNWFRWWLGDWPLLNGFYRPVVTATLQFDLALFGTEAAGYGWTNAAFASLCVLALFVLAKQLFSLGAALASAAVFSFWVSDYSTLVFTWFWWLLPAGIALGIVLGAMLRARILSVIWFFLLLGYLWMELEGRQQLVFGIVQWIPGRTASLSFLLGALALACALSFSRCKSQQSMLLTLVATFVLALLSIGSYEQAYMLPAIGYVMFAFRGEWKSKRALTAAGVLAAAVVAMVLARHFLVGWQTSGYQQQQLKPIASGLLALLYFLIPATFYWTRITTAIASGWLILMTVPLWHTVLEIGGMVRGSFATFTPPWRLLPLYLAAFLAFLPMAFLHHFPHYLLWPMGFLALFCVALAQHTVSEFKRVFVRQAVQAPPRSDPAPGSLPAG